jgi:hypothetical protein
MTNVKMAGYEINLDQAFVTMALASYIWQHPGICYLYCTSTSTPPPSKVTCDPEES